MQTNNDSTVQQEQDTGTQVSLEQNEQVQQTTGEVDFDAMSDDELNAYIARGWTGEVQQTEYEDEPNSEQPVEQNEQSAPVETNSESSGEPKQEETPAMSDEEMNALFVKEVTSPFKARGREMQVNSPKEVIRLMQKGVDYEAKMTSLKPLLGIMNTIRKSGLAQNPEKLQQLIDISKGDSNALAALIQEQQVDLSELPDASDDEFVYTPQTTIDTPEQMEVAMVTDQLQQDIYGKQVLQAIGNWDQSSINALATNPNELFELQADMRSGKYNAVMSEIENRRYLGRLDQSLLNKSTYEVYKAIGDELQAGYDEYVRQQQQQQQGIQQPTQPTVPQQRYYGNNVQPSIVRATTIAPKTARATPVGSQSNNQNFLDEDPNNWSNEQLESFLTANQKVYFAR